MSKANILWRGNQIVLNLVTDQFRFRIPIVDHKKRMIIDNLVLHVLDSYVRDIFGISLSFDWFRNKYREYRSAVPALKIVNNRYVFRFVPESILIQQLFLRDSNESIDNLISFKELCNLWKRRHDLYLGLLFACNLLEVYQKILTEDFHFTLDSFGYPVFRSQNFSHHLNIDPRDIILLLSSPEVPFDTIWSALPNGRWMDEFKSYLRWILKDKPDVWVLTTLI